MSKQLLTLILSICDSDQELLLARVIRDRSFENKTELLVLELQFSKTPNYFN